MYNALAGHRVSRLRSRGIYHKYSMPPRRDPLKDQQLVRDLWQKVEARMDCSNALTAFLTQKLDDCGQTVVFDAFDLVRQVLNPEGFVRIAHKSADQPIGSAITMPDSPWTAEGSMIDRQWDFQGTWRRHCAKWEEMNKYKELDGKTVKRFCTEGTVEAGSRYSAAKYRNRADDLDGKYSIPAVAGKSLDDLNLLERLPDNLDITQHQKAIRRWEVIVGVAPREAYERIVCQNDQTNMTLAQLVQKNKRLEPYWRLSWRAGRGKQNKKWSPPPEFGYNTLHTTCDLQDKPDLIIEVGYFSTESGLFSKRVIICEVDGDDKTDPKKPKAVEVDDDGNESDTKKTDDPIKLALKLMTSTCAQNALQPQTYHIRANYAWYFNRLVDKSLLATTSVDLPEFADLVRLYGKDPKSQDYTNLHHAIHFVLHMFKAHVKIAFLIYMQVVHNIDVRNMDKPDCRMRDHCFFVNFEGSYIPDQLTWEDKTSQSVRVWLEKELMLHTRVQIKTYDLQQKTSKWVKAPVLHTSSRRSALNAWNASITSARLPRYPYEKETCVPVVCASIQRVDMKSLILLVQEAAEKSLQLYNESIILKKRDTVLGTGGTQPYERREFPDWCFLTRTQQYDRNAWYNDDDKHNVNKLRCRKQPQTDENLEFQFGYEEPCVTRDFKQHVFQKWDQLDVRMHFFNKAMEDTGEAQWRDASNGMWYVQDYIDFFNMLRNLKEPSGIQPQDQKPAILNASVVHQSTYAMLTAEAGDEETKTLQVMPQQTPSSQRAYHMFSILSWFFDSRDSGACRWQWEDHVLQYFGADCEDGVESEFDKFLFRRSSASMSDTKYFDNTWFLMTLFMEVNFRNAVAAMHYRLWDTHADTKSMTGSAGLQAKAKELYNRQHSLLNTRARCSGLQGVSAGLSWKKSPERNCLRNLLLSSLDDTLPELDPQLQLYLRQFNAPNAALFLRTIEVSNVLALHELALQHKLANQTSPSSSKLEARLAWFEPAVQSEIRYLLQRVERDDSVFTAAPIVHPTKALVLEEELMRKWVRQTLGVHQHLHTLRCPLDVKFHMFTSPETYRVLMQLFCTKTQLDNSHTQRPVVFVLLQIYLAAWVLRGYDKKEDSIERDNPLTAIVGASFDAENDGFHAAEEDDDNAKVAAAGSNFKVKIKDSTVPCVIGSSLMTWPLRDQNLWCKPERDEKRKVVFDKKPEQSFSLYNLQFEPGDQGFMKMRYPEHKSTIDMTDDEQRRWLMLACARPGPCQYVQNYDCKFKAGEKLHEFTVQGCAVRQQPEYAHESTTGRQRDTMITSVSHYEVSAEHLLQVVLCDDADSYIFFEKTDVPSDSVHNDFPRYICDIIPKIPRRTLIYVPQVFARNLRQEQIHDKLYKHAGSFWRMACVGYRAWAWKRLLVKTILFDALTKIVTRSPMLLSLFEFPADGGNQDHIRKYLEILEETKDAFGSMEIKNQMFQHALKPKQIQVTFSVFRREDRVVEIDGTRMPVYECSKMQTADRQVLWCQFLSRKHDRFHLAEQTSRFMLVDKRIHNALVHVEAEKMMQDGEVFQYRSYVYTKNEISSCVISFKGDLYVKFPSNYSVMQHKNIKETGEVKNTDAETIFATCFDCRTYSCMKPEYMLLLDSEYTRNVLQNHSPEKLRKCMLDLPTWPSTPSDNLDTSLHILRVEGTRVKDLVVVPCLNTPTCPAWSERSYHHMYSLPDFYRVERLIQTAAKDNWVAGLEYEGILQKAERYDLMRRLRKSTKYIPAASRDNPQHTDNAGEKIVTDIVDYNSDANFKAPFKDIIMNIRNRIRPRPNDDDI